MGRDPEIPVPLPPDLIAILMKFVNLRIYPRYFKAIVMHSFGRMSAVEKTFIPSAEVSKIYVRARIYVAIYGAVIGAEYYLCGPPMMIKACNKMLASLGVSSHQIAYDEF